MTSIPLTSIPLTSIPLTSIDLASVPLTSIAITDTPLTSIPLTSIPVTIANCTLVDCARDTLGDAARAGAIFASITLADIQAATSGIRLGEIVDALSTTTRAEVVAALADADLTLDDLTSLDDLVLGDLPLELPELAGLTLGQLGDALVTFTFGDLLGAIVDPATGQPFPELEADLRAGIATEATLLGDLGTLGDVTLGDLLDGLTDPLTLADIEPILGFITFQTLLDALVIDPDEVDFGSAQLGDLSPDQLGQLTLGDILAFAGNTALGDLLAGIDAELANYTLGDLLLALIDPSSLSFGGVDFVDVRVSALPDGTSPASTFEARFAVTGDGPATVEVRVDLPSGTSYRPGTARIVEDPDAFGPVLTTELPPDIHGNSLSWAVTAQAGVPYVIEFDVVLGLRLGATSVVSTARVAGTDAVEFATTDVVIVEGAENNDFPPPNVTEADEGFVYLTYIATPTDNDVYRVRVGENDQLYVQLSNLDANLDLALYADVDDPLVGAPLTSGEFLSPDAPLAVITDPDAKGTSAEPLDDFRRLDFEDPDLELIAVSNRSGTSVESLATGRLRAGTYYLQVFGANGATNVRPAALQLQIAESETPPECRAFGPLPAVTSPGQLPAIGPDVDTLILLNESRLEQIYGADARSDVNNALDELTAYLASDPGINPAVVAVDGSEAVRSAYSTWDNDSSCDPETANAVVAAINSEIIDPVREQLEHVVILGGDEQIPMARLIDSTRIANEYDFRNEFDGDLAGADPDARNTFTSTFWESRILSDEPYGDSNARSLGNRFLYVTDIALGRVVESPEDIISALDTFVEFDGNLAIDTATVLGYDFLIDGSEEIAEKLDAGLSAAGFLDAVDDSLADGVDENGRLWDRADATRKLAEAGRNALISLNAHFDHYRALPAIGDKVPGFNDNLIAADVAATLGPDALRNSLIFSMGCHSGLAVSDITIAGTNRDWAEVMSQQGSLYIGNTGFGYGDTEVVAYTERLMVNFAEQVTAPFDIGPDGVDQSSTVGQALAWAKNDYISGLSILSVYDEKAVMEATFYGLPFYRVGLPTGPLPAIPSNDPVNDVLDVAVDADNTPRSTPSGTYYSNTGDDGTELVIVAPGRPIQPKVIVDVSVVDQDQPRQLATVAHGAIIESMESTYLEGVDPVIAVPIFDEAAGQPEPPVGDVIFPVRPLDITTSTGPAGERQQLVLATGQFNSQRSVQRLDDNHQISVYYSDSSDFTPPTIGAVTTSIEAATLSIEVPVVDADSDVIRVVALVAQNPGLGTVEWSVVELTETADVWLGELALRPQTIGVEFILQALDSAGNVAFAAAGGQNFGESTVVPSGGGGGPGGGDLQLSVGGTEGQPGFYAGDVTVGVTGTAGTIQFSVDGGALTPIPDTGSFTISGPGRHTYLVVTSSGEVATGEVRIDTDGAPRIDIRTPATDAVFSSGTAARFDVTCVDDTRDRCELTLTGTSPPVASKRVSNGSLLPTAPGTYVLEVVSTDRVGNETTGSREFTITRTVGAPALLGIAGPTEPRGIDVPVQILTTFVDPSGTDDDYTLEIDWGDGVVEVVAVDEALKPSATSAATVPASRVYATAGVYSITVTVRDDAGGEDVGVYEFVVVFDPATRGRVAGTGFYWSGPEAHSGSPWFGSPAFFGYNARYRSGAAVPSGETKLKLVGEFLFRSTAYDYLIVNDTMAVAEGTGTTGGGSSYRFRVQGIDNGFVDFFQITIWNQTTGAVLYDNGVMYKNGTIVENDRGDRVLLGGIKVSS